MDDWAVSRAPGNLDAFRVGADGGIYTAAWQEDFDPPGRWRGWTRITDQTVPPDQPVCALSHSPRSLDVFVVTEHGILKLFRWDADLTGGEWRGPVPIGGINTNTAVTGVSRGRGKLDIFARTVDGRVVTSSWDQATDPFFKWTRGWTDLGDSGLKTAGTASEGVRAGHLAAAAPRENRMDLFRFAQASIFHIMWTGMWHGWQVVGEQGPASGRPSAVTRTPTSVDVFTLELFADLEEGRGWRGWHSIDSPGSNMQPIKAVARGPSNLDAFIIGQMESSDPNIICHGSLEPGADFSDPSTIHWTWTALRGHEPNRTRIGAVSRKPTLVDVFSHGPGETLFTATFDADAPGEKWSAWKEIVTTTVPAAQAVLDPNNFSFGTAEFDSDGMSITINVRNPGAAPLAVNHIGFEGRHPKDFRVVSNNCLGRTIPPGGAGQIVVRFHPTGTQDRQAKLRVSNNAADSPQFAHFDGFGLEPAAPPVDSQGRPTM